MYTKNINVVKLNNNNEYVKFINNNVFQKYVIIKIDTIQIQKDINPCE